MKSDMGGAAAVLGRAAGRRGAAARGQRRRLPADRREHARRRRAAAVRRAHDLRRQDGRGAQHRRRGPPGAGRRPGPVGEDSPDMLIDVATLTGAQLVALGHRGSPGSWATTTPCARGVVDAASRAGEQIWPMPLPAEMRKGLDSPVADIANVSGEPVRRHARRRDLPEGVRGRRHRLGAPGHRRARRSTRASPTASPRKGGTGAAVRMLVQVGGQTWPQASCNARDAAARQQRAAAGSTSERSLVVSHDGELRPRHPRRRQRRLRLRPARRRARHVGRAGRAGQGRRHLPAPRLHPDQGAAARRRGRRQRPGRREVRRRSQPSTASTWPASTRTRTASSAGSTRACTGLVKSRGIDVVEGAGRLARPTAVQVGDRADRQARHVVLATGS